MSKLIYNPPVGRPARNMLNGAIANDIWRSKKSIALENLKILFFTDMNSLRCNVILFTTLTVLFRSSLVLITEKEHIYNKNILQKCHKMCSRFQSREKTWRFFVMPTHMANLFLRAFYTANLLLVLAAH